MIVIIVIFLIGVGVFVYFLGKGGNFEIKIVLVEEVVEFLLVCVVFCELFVFINCVEYLFWILRRFSKSSLVRFLRL